MGSASIISQYISAILILRLLFKGEEGLGLRLQALKITTEKAKRILKIGIPSAFQFTIFAIGLALSYAVSAFMDCTIATSRGLGKSIVPTIIVIMGSCVFLEYHRSGGNHLFCKNLQRNRETDESH